MYLFFGVNIALSYADFWLILIESCMKTLVTLLLLCWSFASYAAIIEIDINNASFEDANPFNNVHYNHSVVGWVDNGFGTMDTLHYTGVKVDGSNNVWSNGGFLEQSLTNTLQVGTYQFSIWFGDRTDTSFPNSSAQLFAGNNLVGELVASAGSVVSGWSLLSASFEVTEGSAGIGELLRIRINSGGIQTLADDVRLSYTPVPEPGTIGIFALALLAIRRLSKR